MVSCELNKTQIMNKKIQKELAVHLQNKGINRVDPDVFVELVDFIEKDRIKQLDLSSVSHRRELLVAYELKKLKYVSEVYAQGMAEKTVDEYLATDCG